MQVFIRGACTLSVSLHQARSTPRPNKMQRKHHVIGSGSESKSCAVLLVRETAAHPFLALALRSGLMPCLAHLEKLDISGASPSA